MKKYLPIICSRNLEISREKQLKIFETFERVTEFLVGDTVENIQEDDDLALPSIFSKDQHDQMLMRQSNFQRRQKLMRELYLIESLIHIIYIPFTYGEFVLSELKQSDVITKVCKQAYNLIKLIGIGYFQNEMYVSQWINLYFDHAMNTNVVNNIGAESTLISIVDNNKKLLEIQITRTIIQNIIKLCKDQNRDMQMIQLLKAICSC